MHKSCSFMTKRENLKNKRAQFFVIFAVIIGVLLIGAASLVNQARSNDGIDSFNSKCENYKNEIYRISQAASNGKQDQEFEFIKDFSVGFIDYLNDSYDASMYFLYGNSTAVLKVVIPGEETLISPFPPENFEVGYDKFIRTYNLKEDNSFHFLMVASKDKEVYVCES